jgi:hypothetical protein
MEWIQLRVKAVDGEGGGDRARREAQHQMPRRWRYGATQQVPDHEDHAHAEADLVGQRDRRDQHEGGGGGKDAFEHLERAEQEADRRGAPEPIDSTALNTM